jgi:two-component system, cell cycle response regulator DivK
MYKIAIVDDAEDSREFLYYLLRDRYTVLRCDGGNEAIRTIREHQPHLVLMDISLPDIDGIDVLKLIRSDNLLPRIPFIALTAHAMSGDKEKYLLAGFDDYVSKPIIDIDILLTAIEKLIR